jgi:alpha-galactosidase
MKETDEMIAKTKWIAGVVAMLTVVGILVGPAWGGQAGKGPLKVFILAGQSNMQGAGQIKANPKRNGGKGSLQYIVRAAKTAEMTRHVVDKNGDWIVRDDVWIWYFDRKGGLTAGYGSNETTIGPEFQFGHAMGQAFDNQVLLIKIAWGGKSLQKDFRPPSSGGQVGPYYTEMLKHVKDVLGNIKKHFPDYDGKGYELAGFGWHQGWNDRVNQAANDEYEKNLVNFIRDVRKALGVKDLPFVIAETGMSGHKEKHPRALSLMKAQAAVAKYEEFKGNAAFVGTKDFFRPKEESPSGQAYHWNSNALTYFLIGDGMAKAMISLIEGPDTVATAGHPDTQAAGWSDLLKPDLSNAIYPKGVWSVTDGVMTATKDINLWSKKQYEDFMIDLEFKTDKGTNSGVIVHCSDTKRWIPNSVEIQIADDYAAKWAKSPKTWQCGAIFGHLAASKQRLVKKPGKWNRYTITCKGKVITVVLNGQKVTEMDMSKWTSAKVNPAGDKIPPWLNKPKAALPLKGHVGFQGKHAGAPIYFRNIRIKEL